MTFEIGDRIVGITEPNVGKKGVVARFDRNNDPVVKWDDAQDWCPMYHYRISLDNDFYEFQERIRERLG